MKKYQKGGAAVVALVGIVGLLLLVAAVCVISAISANNRGVEMENNIKTVYKNNENLLASYQQKVQEAAQVPTMARDDLAKVIDAAIKGRYGQEGSKAVFQAIQEQNPSIDPSLYRKIQQIIESGRDEFKQGQTKLVDVKRVYENQLGYAWSGLWLRLLGFPKINLDDYKIITSDYAAEAFQTGKEKGPIKLRAD